MFYYTFIKNNKHIHTYDTKVINYDYICMKLDELKPDLLVCNGYTVWKKQKVSEFLIKDNWTQNVHCRDANNNQSSVFDPNTMYYCIVGAMRRCMLPHEIRKIETRPVEIFNDCEGRTFEQVKKYLLTFGL